MSEALGQPVVVENRPGAAGLLGTDMAAKAPADGYTLLMFVDTNTIFPSTVKQLQHDPVTSFAPITLLGRGVARARRASVAAGRTTCRS